jgi:hypothetical protein
MSNHFHLLLRTADIPLSRFMRRLLTGYVVTFNLRHNRSGHLFRTATNRLSVMRKNTCLNFVRYIHLNPLRAGLVSTLDDLDSYPWCGHSVLMKRNELPGQETAGVLARFAKTVPAAGKRYHSFIYDGITMGRRKGIGQIRIEVPSFTNLFSRSHQKGGVMYKRLLLVLAGLSLLAGCGGGGSSAGGGSGYTGVTTQATVSTSNAKALSADAYSGSQLSAAVSGVAKEAPDASGQPPLLQEVAGMLERSVTTIVNVPASAAKVAAATATAQNTIPGFSGSYTYSISVDQSSGAFSGVITFNQYKETSLSSTISGSIAFSGVYSQATGTFSSLNISLSNLIGTNGSRSYSLAGSESYSTSGTTKTVTMSIVLTDNVSKLTYWVKDFALTLVGSSLSITGTYYDPIHGFVVISTVTPLTVTTIDATPTSGQLLFSGRNGTTARLTFTSGGYIVEVDTAGNGTYVVVS